MLFMFILKILVAVVVVVILITMIYHLYTPTAEERKGPSASRFSHAFICIKIKIIILACQHRQYIQCGSNELVDLIATFLFSAKGCYASSSFL